VPGVQWLFIFARRKCSPSTRFRAFTANDAHSITELPEGERLNPDDEWYD